MATPENWVGPDDAAVRETRDVVAFGQEYGRVLSDGRIVGRAEPFAKVFPSSRAVKRAVGVTAWAILEDIALDASIDVEGRLVAATNVRRIAANLGLSPNTVTRHLGVLRQHGFVLHEEQRDEGSGRYETSRYVLDPSACVERFTVTPPRPRPHDKGAADGEAAPGEPDAGQDEPRGAVSQDLRRGPCPKNCDTEPAVSQSTVHGGLRHNYKKKVGFQEPTTPPADVADAGLVARLTGLGIDAGQAARLVATHAPQAVIDAVDAVASERPRSPAGWVVAALRDGWELSAAAEQSRAERAGRRRREQRDADARRARQRADVQAARGEGWAAAVSGALDDRQLAAAIARVTRPLPGVGRRPVAMVRDQLVAWAAATHAKRPSEPLPAALAAALSAPAGHDPPPLTGGLPAPPEPCGVAAPLQGRIAACLHHLQPQELP